MCKTTNNNDNHCLFGGYICIIVFLADVFVFVMCISCYSFVSSEVMKGKNAVFVYFSRSEGGGLVRSCVFY